MCGIVGISLAEPNPDAGPLVRDMSARLAHRGPDSAGGFACPRAQTFLGFRRLAIRDLSPRADQPMHSASGRTVLVFNGEIYNADDVARRYCPDIPRRTTGDTEVLVEAWERHGPAVLAALNGMFAIAAWDRHSGTVTLARDRVGKKPLYLYHGSGFTAFASELRALRPLGLVVDPSQSPLFLHLGYLPAPTTFYRRVSQLRPAEVVQIGTGTIRSRTRFYRFSDIPWGVDKSCDGPALEATLADAVRVRTVSDVRLGSFLSGGVDSALIAAQLAQLTQAAVPTCTVTFRDDSHDEAAAAAATAAHLGLPHELIPVDESELEQLALDYLDCYEQPYADSSGLATLLLCRAARQNVTVALSGDGGDEFFGGYRRYRWFRWALRAQHAPLSWRRFAGCVAPGLDSRRGPRLARWLAAGDPATLYARIVCNFTAADIPDVVPEVDHHDAAPQLVRDVFHRVAADPLARAACFDAQYYLPDDLQVKIDRASMRVGLEIRCPLLDFRLVERGASLSTAAKFRGGLKSPLRDLLARHLPPCWQSRPKHGFSVPLARWLRGPMRDVVHDTLHRRAVRESGWLNHHLIRELWRDLLSGRSAAATSVWSLFVLAAHLGPSTGPGRLSGQGPICGRVRRRVDRADWGRATSGPAVRVPVRSVRPLAGSRGDAGPPANLPPGGLE
jgi:asparagine synthase (glutamine-hydrolysing)